MKKFKVKKSFLIVILVLSIFFLILLTHFVYTSFINKFYFDKHIEDIINNNVTEVFSIDKIALFSSSTADSIINSNNTTTINDLIQYTDIAIFINNNNSNFSMKNTLKSVSIQNISFNTKPLVGTPNLYYKSLTDFSTDKIVTENLINSSLNFSVTSEDELDYNKPILFNNCANPITLSYVNSNIKNDYTIQNMDGSISYDGSLLKTCNVPLNELNCSLSFTIFIENNLGENFKCPVYIDIPLSGSSSIYDGSYTYIYNPDYKFLQY